jgi:tryptophanyl-tRNA synthetase
LFVFDLLALFLEADELADWKTKVEAGGVDAPGYGHLKMRLKDAIEEHFAEAREKRLELLANPKVVDDILAAGADKARARAREVRDRALHACGLR